MKKITSIALLSIFIAGVFLSACSKIADDFPIPSTPTSNFVCYFTPQNQATDTVVLSYSGLDTADNDYPTTQFTWSYVNDNGKTVHSYTLQIDSVGGNFAKPYSQYISNLTYTYNNDDLEAILLGLNFQSGVKGELEARVMYLSSSNVPEYSDTVDVFIYPY